MFFLCNVLLPVTNRLHKKNRNQCGNLKIGVMDPPTASKVRELAKAVIDLRDVCLHEGSKWAAEQLKGLLMDEELNQAVALGCRDAIKICEIHPDYQLGRQYFEEKVGGYPWIYWCNICIGKCI